MSKRVLRINKKGQRNIDKRLMILFFFRSSLVREVLQKKSKSRASLNSGAPGHWLALPYDSYVTTYYEAPRQGTL